MSGLGLDADASGKPGATPSSAIRGQLAYVELPVADSEASASFFEAVFGWSLVRFGPAYAGTVGQGADLGLNAHGGGSDRPLPGILVADLEAALESVLAAGAELTVPIFAFPGGRRFHFREPGGHELAVFAEES
jgi:uncharacterized protein